MKSKKSKTTSSEVLDDKVQKTPSFFGQPKTKPQLSEKELRLLAEEKIRTRKERVKKIKKIIGQFFTILFIVAVIFSMIAIPLLVVLG